MNHKNYKICYYIRVSTEEQAENPEGSIKNQEERLLQTVKLKNMEGNFGEVVATYIDRAKSGKDTNRPELQKMLRAIRAKQVNLVMVSELSRISRNMRDFSDIWELMKASDCGFYSLRENFDTTTAAGEMVLYTLANLAQFERRQVGERVAANMNARAQRGLWNGGHVPIGYFIDKEKRGRLFLNSEEAKIVKAVFDAFLIQGTLAKTAKWLNDNGYKMPKASHGGGKFARLSFFTCDNVHHILKNKTYAGLKDYKQNDQIKETTGQWESIIDVNTLKRVQKILTENKSAKKPFTETRYPYILTGIVRCATCGNPMVGKSAHGKTTKVAYYEHAWATKKNSFLTGKIFKCEPHRVPAGILEKLVLTEVKRLFNNPIRVKQIVAYANKSFEESSPIKSVEKFKADIYGYNSQLEAIVERLGQLPKTVSPKPFFLQMEKIEKLKAEAEEKIKTIESEENIMDKPIEQAAYEKFISQMGDLFNRTNNYEIQSQIIKKMISKVEVGKTSVRLHYVLDGDLAYEVENKKAASDSCGLFGSFKTFVAPSEQIIPESSNSLTVGGA